jgi:hypothetical protein
VTRPECVRGDRPGRRRPTEEQRRKKNRTDQTTATRVPVLDAKPRIAAAATDSLVPRAFASGEFLVHDRWLLGRTVWTIDDAVLRRNLNRVDGTGSYPAPNPMLSAGTATRSQPAR